MQDPEDGAGVAPEDQATRGGSHRRAEPGGSENHILRALGTHRGWCPGKGSPAGRGGGQRATPRPRAGSSPTRPPILLLGTQTEPRARLPTFAKEIWAMGAPGWGFFCREIRSPLRPAAAESGARAGGGRAKSQPLPAAWAGSELAEAQLPPRGPARPGPQDQHPRHGTKHPLCSPPRKGPAWGCGHRGLGQDRPGDAWDPVLGHGAGSGLGTVSRWRGAGIRLQGRRTRGGQGRPTRQREQR